MASAFHLRSTLILLATAPALVALTAAAQAPPPPPPPAAPVVFRDAGGLDAGGRGATGAMMPVSLTGTALIIGQVIDAGTGAGVPNAIVTLGGATPPPPGAVPGGTPGRATGAPPPPPGRAGAPPPAPSVLRQITDGDGRFAFRHLPAGSFSLSASRPGYSDGAYGRLRPQGSMQQLTLSNDERATTIKVRLFRNGVITGSVRDDNGEAVVGIPIRAYRRTILAGRPQFLLSGTIPTDDRGVYRIANLIPGEYVIAAAFSHVSSPVNQTHALAEARQVAAVSGAAVSAAGSLINPNDRFALQGTTAAPSGDASGPIMMPPTTYYPSALVASQAQPIAVGSGEERAGIDLALRYVNATTIAGRLMGPTGPVGGWALNLVPADSGELSSDPVVATAITDQEGAFMFLGIPAGSYVIQTVRVPPPVAAQGGAVPVVSVDGNVIQKPQPPASSVTLWTATPVAVGPEGLFNLGISLRPGLRVAGRVEFDGTAERPPASRLQSVMIVLEPADGRPRGNSQPARVEANGQFQSSGNMPGRYIARVNNAPSGWVVKSITSQGVDIADMPLDLESSDVSGITVTFTDRIGEVRGTVRDMQGTADADAAVVVFPTDSRLWTSAGTSSRRLRMSRVMNDGTYTIGALPAGDYGVVAISEEFAGDWSHVRFLEQIARVATRLTISEGGRLTQDLVRQTIRPTALARRSPAPQTIWMDEATLPTPSGPYVDDDPVDPDPQQTRDTRVEPVAAGRAAISGLVVEGDSNTPVRRARISVRAPDSPYDRAVLTDDAGRFVVGGLAAGNYTVISTKNGYLTGFVGGTRPGRGPVKMIAAAAGKPTEILIRMSRAGVVTGMVRDDNGLPVPNARINLSQFRVTAGQREIVSVNGGTTDDRGVYRIFGLQPGNYLVSATTNTVLADLRQLTNDDWQAAQNDARQPPGARGSGAAMAADGRPVGYSPVYYPGTPNVAEATPVTVAAAQEVQAIDFALRLVPTARIDGMTVAATDGRPVSGVTMMVFSGDNTVTGTVAAITTRADGTFSTQYLPPGRYTLQARATAVTRDMQEAATRQFVIAQETYWQAAAVGAPLPPPPPPPPPPVPPNTTSSPRPALFAEHVVDVYGENITGLQLVLQEGATVSGRTVFTGAPHPPDPQQVRVSLTPAVSSRLSLGNAGAVAKPGQPFVLNGVGPGKYRFTGQVIGGQAPQSSTTGLPSMPISTWTLRSAMLNGRDVQDFPLEVTAGTSVTDVVLTFTDRMAELSGSITDAAGQPNLDLLVLLLPADRVYWTSTTGRRFRNATAPNADGTYRFSNLPAGEYLLVAVSDPDPVDLADRALLEQLAAGALKVTIAEGERKVQNIRTAR